MSRKNQRSTKRRIFKDVERNSRLFYLYSWRRKNKSFFIDGLNGDGSQYKDIEYVTNEVNSLLKQLITIKEKSVNVSEIKVKNRIKDIDKDPQ